MRYARNREDLRPVVHECLLKLEMFRFTLSQLDPDGGNTCIDEDYKIREWHSIDLDELQGLLQDVNRLMPRIEAIHAGLYKPSELAPQ